VSIPNPPYVNDNLGSPAAGDTTAAVQARDALWDAQLALYGQIYAMGAVWNDLAPRAGGDGA
jgi:hypothetical protein